MTVTADAPVIPPGAQVDTGPVRKAAVKGLQQLAAEVAKTYPETTIHRHLTDAADQVRIGNDEGALRHLRAAHASLQPLSLRRLGIGDDGGHVAGRQAIEGVVRHSLMIRDIQDAEQRNREAIARDSYGDDTTAPRDPTAGYGPGALAQKPTARQPRGNRALNAPDRIPAGRTGKDVAAPDAPAKRGSRQFARTWDEVCAVLEMASAVRPYRRVVNTPEGPRPELVRGYTDRRGGMPSASSPSTWRPAPGMPAGWIPRPAWQAGQRDWVARGEAAWAARRKAAEAGDAAQDAAAGHAPAPPRPAGPSPVRDKVLSALQARGIDPGDERDVRAMLHAALHPPGNLPDAQADKAADVVAAMPASRFDELVKVATALRTFSRQETDALRADFAKAKEASENAETRKLNRTLIIRVAFAIAGILFDALIHQLQLPVPDLAQASILLLPDLARETVERVKRLAYGRDDLAGVAVELSARTPMLESTPAPYGEPGGPGLYRVRNNKHSDYFEQVVQALIHKRGMSKEKASAMAWAALRRWEAKSRHPEVRAAAARGLMQERQAEARAHGHAVSWDEVAAVAGRVIDMADVQVKTYQRTVNTPRGPVVQTVATHQQNYRNGTGGAPGPAPSGNAGAKSPWQQMPSRSAEKQRLLSTAKGYRERAAVLGVDVAVFNAALYNALYGSNTTKAQAGAKTAAQSGSTTGAQAGSTTAATTAAVTAALQAATAPQAGGTTGTTATTAPASTGTTAAQAGATTAAQAGATTAAQKGAAAAASAPSATQQAVTAALAAGASPQEVTQAGQQAAKAAAGMSAPQLRTAIGQLQTQITWYNNQAATLTAQAAKLP